MHGVPPAPATGAGGVDRDSGRIQGPHSSAAPLPTQSSLTFDDLRRRPGERYADHMARLREARIFTSWPAVLDGEYPLPLQIGIIRDLEARLDHQRCLVVTLHALIGRLCRLGVYQHALARKKAWRHDVDRQPVEPVSNEHRAGARAWLEHRARRRKELERLVGPPVDTTMAPRSDQGANAAKPMLRLPRGVP